VKDVKPISSDKILDAKDWFMKWFLDMKETSPPEQGKPKWWMKLVLKIITNLLNYYSLDNLNCQVLGVG
jgi:hypothetical protein